MSNDNIGPKTPEKDQQGNETVQKDNDANSSGESNPQDGQNVVNQQQQDHIVNSQDGAGVEEFVDSANNNTSKGNDTPLNNENGAAPGSGAS